MNTDPSRSTATRRERLTTVLWALFAALMLMTTTPARWGWTGRPLVLNLVSFPLAGGLVLGTIALALGVAAADRRHPDRPVRITVAVILAAVSVFQVATVVRRGGWWAEAGTRQPGDLVVVAFNSAGQEPLPAELSDIVVRLRPQVIALPETRPRYAEQLAAEAADAGLGYQVFSQPGPTVASPTSLLISDSLGPYEQDREGSDRAAVVRVVPVEGDGPVVVAVHPLSPQLLGSNATAWQADGREVVAQCTDTPGAIVAGDFNATIDHPQLSDLGHCRDAASQVGRAAQGTWPASLPATMSAAIDHVLLDGNRWRTVDLEIDRVGRSDHRLIIATLRER